MVALPALLGLGATWCLAQAPETSAAGENILLNPGLEQAESVARIDPRYRPWAERQWDVGPLGLLPAGWDGYPAPNSYGILTLLRGVDQVMEGEQCLRLDFDRLEGTSNLSNAGTANRRVGRYRVGLWVRGHNAGCHVAFIQYDAAGGAGYCQGALTDVVVPEEWTWLTGEMAPTRADISVMLFILVGWRDPQTPEGADSFLCVDGVSAEYLGR